MAAGQAHSADLLGHGLEIELFILGGRKKLFSKTSRPALVPAQLYGLFPQR
jgi:hypothetical protein